MRQLSGKYLVAPIGLALFAGNAVSAEEYDYAEVVKVERVVEIVEVEVPKQRCWTESQPVAATGPGYAGYTPEIFGAILGGAIGYQFGNGRGQDIATVAGAVLGGSIGHDAKVRHQRTSGGGGYQSVERCETVSEVHTEERVAGYDVTYRYRGDIYQTTMKHDPGDRVKVAVSVVAIE